MDEEEREASCRASHRQSVRPDLVFMPTEAEVVKREQLKENNDAQ
jgi:hypothetical protein